MSVSKIIHTDASSCGTRNKNTIASPKRTNEYYRECPSTPSHAQQLAPDRSTNTNRLPLDKPDMKVAKGKVGSVLEMATTT